MTGVLAATIFLASTAVTTPSSAEMEKAYWDCEFAAIKGQISLDAAAACNEIYEHLKNSKFEGRFDRFLVWWKENKIRELSSRARRGQ